MKLESCVYKGMYLYSIIKQLQTLKQVSKEYATTSSCKSVQPTVSGMIKMELPHTLLISEAVSQLIFINDPPNQSSEPLLQT